MSVLSLQHCQEIFVAYFVGLRHSDPPDVKSQVILFCISLIAKNEAHSLISFLAILFLLWRALFRYLTRFLFCFCFVFLIGPFASLTVGFVVLVVSFSVCLFNLSSLDIPQV